MTHRKAFLVIAIFGASNFVALSAAFFREIPKVDQTQNPAISSGKKFAIDPVRVDPLKPPIARRLNRQADSKPERIPTNLPVPKEGPFAPNRAGQYVPSTRPTLESPPPTQSFQGQWDANEFIPPDSNGAVGTDQLLAFTNANVVIQDKVTGEVLAEESLGSFWSGLDAAPCDPKILFDPYSKRWVATSIGSPHQTSSCVLLAVTNSEDALSNWYRFRITVDSTGTTWADYPSIGFNKNWVVIQVNIYQVTGDKFVRSQVYVINKTDLYSGQTTSTTVFSLDDSGASQAPMITYDANLENEYLIQSWTGDNGDGKGYLRMYALIGPIGKETLIPMTLIPYPATWCQEPPDNVDFAPQLGSSKKLQVGDDRVKNVVYRNGSIWLSHTVMLPTAKPSRSAVQWWQLSEDGSVSQFGRIDDTSGKLFYAFPSIAVNKHNGALIGFSRFASDQYPSANYAYRAPGDSGNSFRGEVVVKLGKAPYFKSFAGPLNRWGDFSNSVVDPSDDVTLWTIQEYSAYPFKGADRWGTWWAALKPK